MSIVTIEQVNERRRFKVLQRQVRQNVRAQIKTHADLETILHRIPDPIKRRQFFESIKEFLPFKAEWGAAQTQETEADGSENRHDGSRSCPDDDRLEGQTADQPQRLVIAGS